MKNDHSQTFSGIFFFSRLRLNAKPPSLIRQSLLLRVSTWSCCCCNRNGCCCCRSLKPQHRRHRRWLPLFLRSDAAAAARSSVVGAGRCLDTASPQRLIAAQSPGQETSRQASPSSFLSFHTTTTQTMTFFETNIDFCCCFSFFHRNFHWLRVWFIKSSINEIHQFLLHC